MDALDPTDPEAGQRSALSFAVLIVMFMQIVGFGLAVAMGVVEEKSSRVVELLLSTIRPLDLLWGKVAESARSGWSSCCSTASSGSRPGSPPAC